MILNLRNFIKIPLTAVVILVVSMLPAQVKTSPEYQIKAVFLFNFTQFVEWPSNAFPGSDTPLVIGVFGDDPFGSYLEETISGEKINGHPLIIEHYRNVQQIKLCHVLFLNLSEAGQINHVLSSLKGRNILTVSDATNFTKQGGIIKFFTEGKKIRIQINQEIAKASDLTISSKLLSLADVVTQKR